MTICAHCGQEALGYATVNGVRLCHDEIRDCYHDVTVHGQEIGKPGSTYRMKNGQVLTEADFEALADEAEAGYFFGGEDAQGATPADG